ncbi:hypothetical protein HD554DRAFT_2315254 [Boletus coccyginus]|nr:hypothetical protein HD554DRAFT_2315254 [Boletus coccyginus]
MISAWRGKSGVHWDNQRGANIQGTGAEEVFNTFVEKNPTMKEFRNKGWTHLEKMDDILPGGGSMGFSSYSASTSSNVFAPSSNVTSPPSPPATIPSSLSATLPPSTSATLPSSSPTTIPPSSSRATSSAGRSSKKRILSILPSDGLTVTSSPSAPNSKRSCISDTSQAAGSGSGTSGGAIAGKSRSNPTGIALQSINSSLRHINDNIGSNFVDPLKTVQDAIVQVSNQEDIPPRYVQFLAMQIP